MTFNLEKLIDEYDALNERIIKLNFVLFSNLTPNVYLEPTQRSLMVEQLISMIKYSETLLKRIENADV